MIDSVAALLSAAREVVNCDHEGGEGPCESHLLKLGAALAAWETRPALRDDGGLARAIGCRVQMETVSQPPVVFDSGTNAERLATCARWEAIGRAALDQLEDAILGPRTADTTRKG